MFRDSLRTAVALVIAATAASSAVAQVRPISDSVRQTSLASFTDDPCFDDGVACNAPDWYSPAACCPRPYLFGSVEVTYLRPRLSGATPAFAAANGGRMIENDFNPGVRYSIGYRNPDGPGIRGRYWSTDESYDFVAPFAPAQLGIEAEAADLEFTFDQAFRAWDLQFASGLRFGKLRYVSNTAGAFGVGEASFEGLGPTVAAEVSRAFGRSGFSLFTGVRGSLLFGELRNASLLLNMPAGPIRDEFMQIYEHQLGGAYTRDLKNGAQLQVRAAWETQYWMSDTLSDDVYGIGSNLGLMGPVMSVEYRY